MITKLSKDSDRRIYVEYLVSDDDSFIRSHLCYTTNGGNLEADVPQPKFLADPSHRIKIMCSPIYKMVINTKDLNKCKKIDFLRLKKYTTYYLYQSINLPVNDFL